MIVCSTFRVWWFHFRFVIRNDILPKRRFWFKTKTFRKMLNNFKCISPLGWIKNFVIAHEWKRNILARADVKASFIYLSKGFSNCSWRRRRIKFSARSSNDKRLHPFSNDMVKILLIHQNSGLKLLDFAVRCSRRESFYTEPYRLCLHIKLES